MNSWENPKPITKIWNFTRVLPLKFGYLGINYEIYFDKYALHTIISLLWFFTHILTFSCMQQTVSTGWFETEDFSPTASFNGTDKNSTSPLILSGTPFFGRNIPCCPGTNKTHSESLVLHGQTTIINKSKPISRLSWHSRSAVIEIDLLSLFEMILFVYFFLFIRW